MIDSLKDKVAFVSGGSRGIGFACAMRLASGGANVFLVSSNLKKLKLSADAIRKKSAALVEVHAADLRLLEGCEAAVGSFLKTFGKCDILINSAGATKAGEFMDQPDEEMLDGFSLKFHSAVRLCRLMWSELKKTKGCVINIVGGMARTPTNDFLVGGAVNAALANFSKGLANQGLIDDVNVNWINPGLTETERSQAIFEKRAHLQNKSVQDIRQGAIASDGLRRLGRPEDVSELVAYLCGPHARHIHGTGISVDGGGSKGYY